MGLIQLVIMLLVVGVLLWVIEQAPFVSATIKPVIRWVVLVVVVLWLLAAFVGDFTVPRLHR
jgi:hypothetical protein